MRKGTEEKMTCQHINQSARYPQKKMLWESFTWNSVGFLVLIQGLMNMNEYIDTLRRKVLPDLNATNGNGIF